MSVQQIATKQTYTGLFTITLATLMYEILLTRIFSVTMWYHFAFMAISVAMFGMTVGAIIVYLFPEHFTHEKVKYHLALSALLFALSTVVSFLTHLCIPFIIHKSLTGLFLIALTYSVIAVPFVFSGICVCLALTKFPGQVSKLYGADLGGAALGCILLIYTLKITDGPTAVVVVALLACIGAAFFAVDTNPKRLFRNALVFAIIFGCFAVLNTFLANRQASVLRLMWVKDMLEHRPLYEKWNSFSRIRVKGNPDVPSKPFGWGLSSIYPPDKKVKKLSMDIDSTAGTVITAFNGDLHDVEHLKYDVTSIVHYIRPDARVLIIGTGGGRDVLSALAFKQKSIVGVEINENIINTVNNKYGDFTGHLDKIPNVTFINDEARSYIARSKEKFDIIQASLIDTWAATASGAFVLTENSLYTVEAWKIFLSHLTPRGVLTFSRWYRQKPNEMYRLVSLATVSLMDFGVKNPRNHMVIVRPEGGEGKRIATLLVSRGPFTDKDLDILEDIAKKLRFRIIFSPRTSVDNNFKHIASGKNLNAFIANFPVNISAPTDDSPFFFNMLRLRDIFNRKLWPDIMKYSAYNMKAVFILGALLIIVIGLTLLCIIVPLWMKARKTPLRGSVSLLVFFACIGLGFMLVEISLMQKLIIFLGHPTYGLSVVLFTLLLSGGLGSYSTQRIGNPGRAGVLRLLFLTGFLVLFGNLATLAINSFQGSVTPVRIFIAVMIIAPLGFFMGMAFPLGMKVANERSTELTPWLWGINGATSVCASVIAVAIALTASISMSFWTGLFCYSIAVLAFVWAATHQHTQGNTARQS